MELKDTETVIDKTELARLFITSRQYNFRKKAAPYVPIENEQWKPIPQSNFYYVSDLGRVRKDWTDKKGVFNQYMITPYAFNGQYFIEMYPKTRTKIKSKLSELVAQAFLGQTNKKGENIPKNHLAWTVCFKDGDGLNCHVDNLIWMRRTKKLRKYKVKRAYKKRREYTDKYGHVISKPSPLTSEECQKVFDMVELGYTQVSISKILNCNQQFISALIHGKIKYK